MINLQIPGDKSISHRAIILGAISTQIIKIENLLFADDVLSTVNAMRALGVKIELNNDKSTALVYGVGLRGLKQSNAPINCGNSGTTMRLLAGVLAAQSFDSVLIGDASLMKRPMARIAKPLRLMGAEIALSEKNTAPIKISGGQQLKGICYESEVASAQVKSCVLLAGLYAEGKTEVREKVKTRDHTERMLDILSSDKDLSGGVETRSAASQKTIQIPGDISSAAFFIVAAAITPGSDLVIRQVGVNPHRTGVIDILKLMGADITLQNKTRSGAEPVADVCVKYAPLRGLEIPREYVVSAIDEFPAIFIAAALAEGKTTLRNAKELRVKETDRIAAMAKGLQTLGVSVEVFSDGLQIEGVEKLKGGKVNSYGDHRVAMAFSIAGTVSTQLVDIVNLQVINTSYPGFLRDLAKIH